MLHRSDVVGVLEYTREGREINSLRREKSPKQRAWKMQGSRSFQKKMVEGSAA